MIPIRISAFLVLAFFLTSVSISAPASAQDDAEQAAS
jgi:hypothetical protein